MAQEFFYRPEQAWVGDVIPYYEDGEFKLFYLHGWRENHREGLDHGWHLLGTTDFVRYDEHGACGIEGGTGHVLKVDGTYHMFYCVFPEGRQLVCHAVSTDLKHWEKLPEETFGPDGEIYEMADWRDPFVFWNEEEGCYWMLVAALAAGTTARKGCVGLLTSADLKHWEYQPPLYAPKLHVGAHECPELFSIGEWWYLVYSSYTGRFGTFYRMSRSPRGPWFSPREEAFDGRAYYAAKSASDGTKRYLFGWNPTKRDDLFGWNPPQAAGQDYDTWDWGGNLVVHEIFQRPDGTLGTRVPESIDAAFSVPVPASFSGLAGEWTETGGSDAGGPTLTCVEPYAFAACATLGELPGVCRISADLSFSPGTQGAGFMLRTQGSLDAAYYVTLEPQRGRVTFRGPIMQSEEGGKTFPYEVELERPFDYEPGEAVGIRILIDGTICEIYVGGRVAMSARMYDIEQGRLGLFVNQGEAAFGNVQIHKLG